MTLEMKRQGFWRVAVVVVGLSSSACWEQVAPQWFAQMKDQVAVQALEGQRPLHPPAGTVPLGGMAPRIDSPVPAFAPEAMALENPVSSTLASVERGKVVYGIYCELCHGADGRANLETTPVAQRLAQSGMVPPSLAAVPGYTDGFLFTKIRYGRPQMPGYPQIVEEDRWHLVNYLRTLFNEES